VSRPDESAPSDFALLARDLGRKLDCRTVVALGCPRPRRLAALARDLDVVAFDRPDRLEALRRELPGAECRHWDPAVNGPLPGGGERLRGAIVVCDGVIETLGDPAGLFAAVRAALAHAACAIVVTADRDLVRRGSPVEARFSGAELRARLESEGLEVGWQGIASSPEARLDRTGSIVVLGGTRAADLPGMLETGARNLSFDPGAAVEGADEPLRIVIASYEFVGPTKTGGIGTAYTSLAEALAEAGHEVTVLYLGLRDPEPDTPFSHWEDHYARKGIRLVELPEAELPRVFYGHFEAKRSYLAYLWLAEADRERSIDVLHFPETLGHGYYSLLAKRQGWAFARATIAVGVHSSTYWVMETNRVAYLTGQEFAADFLERASVALADVVISPSAYMVDWMQGRGWALPERVFVQQYVRSRVVAAGADADADADSEPKHDSGGIDEIVFFGRLETRKGIELFCDALDLLADEDELPEISVAFMGKQTVIEGLWAKQYLAKRGREWPWRWRVLDDFAQPEAVAYLRGNGDGTKRLAVMPSLADNTPNTVMEALALRIPFLASRVGGTAELVHPLDLGRATFDPGGGQGDADLAAALREAVGAGRFEPPRPAVEPDPNESVHLRWHRGVAAASRAAATDGDREPVRATASVSVCVAAAADGSGADAIAAVEAQEHPAVELVTVRRGARNEGVRAATGTYLVFLAEGASIEPGAVSTLVRVAEQTGADIVTAASRWSAGAASGIRPPEGGPAVAGLFYRCFGDAGYMIRREAFERLGGFDPEAEAGSEDHHLLCRAALEGYRIEIVPEPLISEQLGEGVTPGEEIHARSGAVVRAYEERTTNGLAQLPQIARAQWSLAGSKDAQIKGILDSRSWRVTTPLRWVTEKLGRRRKAVEPPS
jgi:glycosyltransferase involved in cell wall biosynthesis